MDKNAFLEKLFRMYPMIFNEYNINDWYDAYSEMLSDPNIDYNHLFRVMLINWDDTKKAPSPKWFKDNHSASIKKDERSAAIRHIEEIKETAAPMPEDFKIRMQALKQKLSMG